MIHRMSAKKEKKSMPPPNMLRKEQVCPAYQRIFKTLVPDWPGCLDNAGKSSKRVNRAAKPRIQEVATTAAEPNSEGSKTDVHCTSKNKAEAADAFDMKALLETIEECEALQPHIDALSAATAKKPEDPEHQKSSVGTTEEPQKKTS